MGDVWPMVHAERAALIDDLGDLGDEVWGQPSLCAEWTVHDVVAHLIDAAMTTRLHFVVGLARAGFGFDRQNARGVARERGASPQETLERLRQVGTGRRSAAAARHCPPVPRLTGAVQARGARGVPVPPGALRGCQPAKLGGEMLPGMHDGECGDITPGRAEVRHGSVDNSRLVEFWVGFATELGGQPHPELAGRQHVLVGALEEAALYASRAEDPVTATAEVRVALVRLVDGLLRD